MIARIWRRLCRKAWMDGYRRATENYAAPSSMYYVAGAQFAFKTKIGAYQEQARLTLEAKGKPFTQQELEGLALTNMMDDELVLGLRSSSTRDWRTLV